MLQPVSSVFLYFVQRCGCNSCAVSVFVLSFAQANPAVFVKYFDSLTLLYTIIDLKNITTTSDHTETLLFKARHAICRYCLT